MAAFAQRFIDVTNDITHISELVVYRKYPIDRADKVTTRFGDMILVSIRDRDTPDQPQYKMFLPQRYASAFKDEHVQAINDGATIRYLVSKGRCPKTNAYQLSVEYSYRRTGFLHQLPTGWADVHCVLWIFISASVY